MDIELKREVMQDNATYPFHKLDTPPDNSNEYIVKNSAKSSCIDDINIYVNIKDDIIKDIYFTGEACAISTASTSIMIKNMIGMNISDALKYINNFENMINEEPYDSSKFEEALAFDETYKQGSRKTCATLPYKGIKEAIEEYINSKN